MEGALEVLTRNPDHQVPGGRQLIGLGRRQGAGTQCSSLDWG